MIKRPFRKHLLLGAAFAWSLAACSSVHIASDQESHTSNSQASMSSIKPHFLEIVTPEMEATCAALEKMHGVTFSDPVPEFGMARTAPMDGGGLISVRAPMHAAENTVVRPYLLVADIDAAVEKAKAGGGTIAMAPTELPGGRGKFAIYFLGGIEHGLWQL